MVNGLSRPSSSAYTSTPSQNFSRSSTASRCCSNWHSADEPQPQPILRPASLCLPSLYTLCPPFIVTAIVKPITWHAPVSQPHQSAILSEDTSQLMLTRRQRLVVRPRPIATTAVLSRQPRPLPHCTVPLPPTAVTTYKCTVTITLYSPVIFVQFQFHNLFSINQ